VEECAYHKDNECHADAIEIRSSGDLVVETSDGTACESFVPKSLES